MIIPTDKLLHVLSGYIIAITLYLLSANVIASFMAAIIAGIAKEVYDYTSKRGYTEMMDMIATAIGGSIALIVMLISMLL